MNSVFLFWLPNTELFLVLNRRDGAHDPAVWLLESGLLSSFTKTYLQDILKIALITIAAIFFGPQKQKILFDGLLNAVDSNIKLSAEIFFRRKKMSECPGCEMTLRKIP